MESQPQNPEFRSNPENFHPCEAEYLRISLCKLLLRWNMCVKYFSEQKTNSGYMPADRNSV